MLREAKTQTQTNDAMWGYPDCNKACAFARAGDINENEDLILNSVQENVLIRKEN